MAPRSEPQILAPSSAPRSVAPSYRSRQRHLRCPTVRGQAPRRQDLWHRDVLSRSHGFWHRPLESKNQFTSPRGPNVNFLKKGLNCKKLGLDVGICISRYLAKEKKFSAIWWGTISDSTTWLAWWVRIFWYILTQS
jgi:hypothetical protein